MAFGYLVVKEFERSFHDPARNFRRTRAKIPGHLFSVMHQFTLKPNVLRHGSCHRRWNEDAVVYQTSYSDLLIPFRDNRYVGSFKPVSS